MQTIKTSSDKINVEGLIYENDKPTVTRDEYLTLSSYNIEANSYIEKNKVIVIDDYDETNDIIIGAVLSNYNQKILGVSRNDISWKGEVISKGVIQTLLDGTGKIAGDTIYSSDSGDLSFTPYQKRIGTLLTTTTNALIFVDIKEKNNTPLLSVTQPNSENSIKIATTEFVNNISHEYKNGKWYPELIADNSLPLDLIFANGTFSLLCVGSLHFSTDGINWTSRQVPRGGNYIAYGNGTYITLPNFSNNVWPILRSTDSGASWSSVNWPANVTNPDGPPTVDYQWHSLTFANGRFFATGLASGGRFFGQILSSTDGVNWSTPYQNIGFAYIYSQVAFGAGLYVCISDNVTLTDARVYTSGDGINWTPNNRTISGGFSGQVKKLIFANGLFVAMNDGSYVLTSPDAVNWTVRALPTGGWRSIIYANALYIMVSDKQIITSPDTINWTIVTTLDGTYSPLLAIAFGNGTYTISNEYYPYFYDRYKTLSSANLTVFSKIMPTENNTWRSIACGDYLNFSRFVIISSDGTNRIMTSYDGTTWAARAVPLPNDSEWQTVTYGNGLFVAVAFSGTHRVITSPDGITWTTRTFPVGEWNGVTYGNGLFVAVGRQGANRVITSPDGINWTARTVPSPNDSQWKSVTYGNGLFVAVASSGTHKIMTSPDGFTWTARTVPSPDDSQWYSITYGNGLFVAVAASGTHKIMTSPDGINWTARAVPSPDDSNWQSITYGNGLFIAVGQSGTHSVMTSTDGINWIENVAENNPWQCIIYFRGLFMAVARDGNSRIMFSNL